MPDDRRPRTIAEMPAQKAGAPKSRAQERGRFFNTGNAFDVKLPPVPDHTFTAEPARVLDRDTPTGLIACDISATLGCAFPATTPLVLARYAKIRAGEELHARFAASGVIAYVLRGSGVTSCAGETVEWNEGDLFVLPGGMDATHVASGADAILWVVTNEPHLAFESLQAPPAGRAPTEVVHYTGGETTRQIDLIYEIGGSGERSESLSHDIAGSALIFSAERQEATRNILPTLTLAMNSLPGGVAQRPHRHNAVAVSLIVKGESCFSLIDGRRKDWSPWATTITPPVSVHSHHNEGSERALFLIVQDGGLYYHTRAMGFEFSEHPGRNAP